MAFFEMEDGRLYYELRGRGRPVVLLHGAWASHGWWRWQVPELARHFQVLTVDVRGHGRSSPLDGVYSVAGFARDLDKLLEGLGVEEAALVGWSMGGLISMQYCLDHPRRVRALVLIATRGHRNRAMKIRVVVNYVRSVLGLVMVLSVPRKYDRTGRTMAEESRGWFERETRKMLSPTAPKEVLAWVASELARNPRKNYLAVARSLWNWGPGEALREIGVPTLIIVGEDDRLTPPRFSRLLHEIIPDSRLVVVENATHYAALERAETVNSEIIDFLSRMWPE